MRATHTNPRSIHTTHPLRTCIAYTAQARPGYATPHQVRHCVSHQYRLLSDDDLLRAPARQAGRSHHEHAVRVEAPRVVAAPCGPALEGREAWPRRSRLDRRSVRMRLGSPSTCDSIIEMGIHQWGSMLEMMHVVLDYKGLRISEHPTLCVLPEPPCGRLPRTPTGPLIAFWRKACGASLSTIV